MNSEGAEKAGQRGEEAERASHGAIPSVASLSSLSSSAFSAISELPLHWLTAVQDPAIAAEIESIYARAAEAIEARKPVCVASGRCCHFEAYGHRLYVTGLEAAYTLSRAPLLAASSPRSSAGSSEDTAAPK